jgi:hypothetical protein
MSIWRFRDPDPDDQRGRPQGVDGVRAFGRFGGVLRVFLIGNWVFLAWECGILVCFGVCLGVVSISSFRDLDLDPDDQRGRSQGVDGVRAWRFEGVLRVFLMGKLRFWSGECGCFVCFRLLRVF